MADPITWGLVLQNKVLLDKIKDLIGGIDVETPISDVLDELKTLINAVDDNVDSVSGKVDVIDGNVDLLLQGRVVKSVQRGLNNQYMTTGAGTTWEINISPVDTSKAILVIDVYGNDSNKNRILTYTLESSKIKITNKATYNEYYYASWQVIEFY